MKMNYNVPVTELTDLTIAQIICTSAQVVDVPTPGVADAPGRGAVVLD